MTAVATPPARVACLPEQQTLILSLSRQVGITRHERHELAVALLGVPVTSFDDLGMWAASRMIAAFRGFLAHNEIERRRTASVAVPTQEPVPDPDAAVPADPCTDGQRRKLFARSRELEFSDEERRLFAGLVVGSSVGTFRSLSAVDAGFVLDGFVGVEAIGWLRNQTPQTVTPWA